VAGDNNVIVRGRRLPHGLRLVIPITRQSNIRARANRSGHRYNGPANGNDEATAVAVDGDNNVLVAGARPAAKLPRLRNDQVLEHRPALWTNRYDGHWAEAVAVDAAVATSS